jgi:hypothetical protein
MKWTQKRKYLLIVIPIFISVLMVSCAAQTITLPPKTEPATTQTVTATTTTTATATLTSAPYTLTVTAPATTATASPTPEVFGSDILKDAKFYTSRELTSYITSTPNINGDRTLTPVYSDVYVDLQEIIRFTPADCIFAPPVPTITSHYDWFVRFNIPSANVKPWLMNWKYALKAGDTTTTLACYLFTQEEFEKDYFNYPKELLVSDIRSGDKGTSESGIRARLMNQNGNFVILWRTNNPVNVIGWWVRIGL